MATQSQLFDSLTILLSRCYQSQEDIAQERRAALKEHTIELINDDRRN
jgi:hypothetical protein